MKLITWLFLLTLCGSVFAYDDGEYNCQRACQIKSEADPVIVGYSFTPEGNENPSECRCVFDRAAVEQERVEQPAKDEEYRRSLGETDDVTISTLINEKEIIQAAEPVEAPLMIQGHPPDDP
jgi:hypothetical protein